MKRYWKITTGLLAAFVLYSLPAHGMPHEPAVKSRAEVLLAKMSLEEKIAQLLIIRVSSTEKEVYNHHMVKLTKEYGIGGVCFFKGGPVRQARLTNRLQAVSNIPLFVAIDGEWGPAMRLDSCTAFPRQMTLGAISSANDSLIYQMGREVALQCKAIGININFAPCIDINNNARNPVINSRSFGENRDKVTAKGALYLQGMRDGGIIGCLKHFPGHGDTESDSHIELPVVDKNRTDLDELELYPYKKLIHKGIDMIMVAHLNVPALDSTPNSVSSLSYPVVTSLLKEELGYDGLIITDGMEMQGLRKTFPQPGEAEIKALLAGIDVLLLPGETEIVIKTIRNAVNDGIIPEELIDNRCLHVLQLKEKMGILDYRPTDMAHIYEKLNSNHAKTVGQTIEQKAITMIKNENCFLPITCNNLNTPAADSIVLLYIGKEQYQYQKLAKKYGLVYFSHGQNMEPDEYDTFLERVAPHHRIIVAMAGTNQIAAARYGIDPDIVACLQHLARTGKAVLIQLGNPYALDYFEDLSAYKSILVAYQPTLNSLDAALQICFGRLQCEGTLPVSIRDYPAGTGIVQFPRSVNFSILPDTITCKIDSILTQGIQNRIYPGCAVLAMRDTNLLYAKTFGYLTYNQVNTVTAQTLYDLASITKPAATAIALMKLYDEHRFLLTDSIEKYVPYLRETDKAHITIGELLTHTSGMPALIPFYLKIKDDGDYLHSCKMPGFEIQVADNLFLRNDYPDTMRLQIANCQLCGKKYLYSDLNFFLLKEMVENIVHRPLADYVAEEFYRPMDMHHTCFNPLQHHFDKVEIAPTEMDTAFRKQIVQGYVHDQLATLFGGDGGNAGLFSTAEDMAKLFSMLLHDGVYRERRYLSKETVVLFTSAHEMHGCPYRGFGFSIPKLSKFDNIVPEAAGTNTYGHTGFTGTAVWCDPEQRLLYIFLSNRVHPDVSPNKLADSNIRFQIHELLYKNISH